MELPNTIPAVMQNAASYFMLNGNEIPEFQRAKIVELMGPGISPVDFTVKIAEILYAVADDVSAEGRTVAGQAASLASINGWHEMSTRGNEIVQALRRKNGEEVSQLPENDPDVLSEYIAPPEEEPEE